MEKVEEKNKKIRTLAYILITIGILLILIILFWPKRKEVEVIFDTKGGTPVENIKVLEGTEITLPETSKTGYTFAGWYKGEEKILGKKLVVKENLYLIARWSLSPKTNPEPIYFDITFDTSGGSSMDKLKVECGKPLKLPKAPERNGYNFEYWEGKYGQVVREGDYLACEDQTIKAVWEKIIVYTCPEGYTLRGRECLLTMEADRHCKDDEITFEEKQCLTDFKEDNICGSKTIAFQNGRVEKVEGEEYYLSENGSATCFYGRETVDNEEICNQFYGTGHYQNNICYVETGGEVNDCPVNHIYLTEDQLKRKTKLEEVEEGCYIIKEFSYFCKDGYSLENNQCVKKIPATVKE